MLGSSFMLTRNTPEPPEPCRGLSTARPPSSSMNWRTRSSSREIIVRGRTTSGKCWKYAFDMASARELGSLTTRTPESASRWPNASPAVFAHELSAASTAGSARSTRTSKSQVPPAPGRPSARPRGTARASGRPCRLPGRRDRGQGIVRLVAEVPQPDEARVVPEPGRRSSRDGSSCTRASRWRCR